MKPIIPRPEGKAPYKTKPTRCPYCGKWTKIVLRRHYKRLDCCEISTMDYGVRKQNKLG